MRIAAPTFLMALGDPAAPGHLHTPSERHRSRRPRAPSPERPATPRRPCARVAVAAIAVALLGLGPACGPQRPSGSPALQRARAYVQEVRERLKIPGLSVAVAIDGRLVWSEGFGHADVERQVALTPRTVFRIGSVSKVLTAAAVARLVQQGKLDLDAPVQRYVPEFPDKGHLVTTRQLVGHLAGVRHYRWDEVRPTARYRDVIEALDLFKDDPLESPPGSRFSYSSYGWVLVSAVVERAAREPFLEHMRVRVFEPLGMRSTFPATHDLDLANRAALYEDGLPVPADELSSIWAAGGFASTAEDLVRFGLALLPMSGFLEPTTRELLLTRQSTRDGEPTPVAVGWMVDALDDGTPVYHHVGTVTGGHAVLLLNPKDRIVVAMLANQSSGFKPSDCQMIACYAQGRRDCPKLVGEAQRQATKAAQIPALLAVIESWERAMERGDIAGVLSALSARFRSPLWSGRADLEESLRAGGVEVDTEDMHVRSAGWDVGAVVRIENITIGPERTAVVVYVVREDAGWRIQSIEAGR